MRAIPIPALKAITVHPATTSVFVPDLPIIGLSQAVGTGTLEVEGPAIEGAVVGVPASGAAGGGRHTPGTTVMSHRRDRAGGAGDSLLCGCSASTSAQDQELVTT